ncbi:unnamed protein product [Triticum turgidum subsp. durum]|uniref:Jacalin-type lectin domain-containing protein n=1 Tax=Triticum turgidum subsp. durum TaxID=4567 RepID=A0A9R0SFI1_TRITD|nr:unnamed protein product [Triticum turgidum subsp. durum]
MARFNGATVFLIIIATVSVYSCAIIAGAALGRTLDSSATTKQTPSDRTLRVSVSFRGLAKDFAKELWGGNHREGRSGRALAGAGDGTAVLSSSPASVSLSPRANRAAAADRESALQPMPVANYTQVNSRVRDDVHTRAAARPWSRHSNFSDEITDEKRPGGRGVIKVGPWGGSGGAPFYMRGGRGVSAPRVRSVTLQYTDNAIHSFYQSSDEPVVKLTLERAEGGGQSRARLTPYEQINFASDEQLIAVEGTYGHCSYVWAVVVTSLTFRTDKGRTYGPYGKETGTPFSIPAANGCIVGFWGRSGWLLDAIGVYIRPCQALMAA